VKATRRDAVDAALRLRANHQGERFVTRFSTGVAIEHFVFMLSVFMLGLTGFAQTFYASLLGSGVLVFFGGIDAVREAHHAFAFILGAASLYHVFNFLNGLIVYRRKGGMWFTNTDWSLLFRLGASRKPARFGRYTMPEKVSYWVSAACILFLGLTGIVQGYPIFTSTYLPGAIIPAARLFHRWQAILCVAVVLIWHVYDVVFRKLNLSVFTGHMSLKDMEEDHPLELEYLEKAAALTTNQTWPVTIEFSQEPEEPIEEAVPAETPKVEEPAEGPKEEAAESSPKPKQKSAKEEK
jgi:cytochrome b subunit of formate dehydrogenase